MPLVMGVSQHTEGHCGRVGDDAGGYSANALESTPSPRLAACRGARGRHRVRSGRIKTSSAERAWVLPSRLTGRASPGKAQWRLRPRSAYRRLREEWCEQAEGAGLLVRWRWC
jgi:hypothetical protein